MGQRSIETWVKILGELDATNVSAEKAIADRILADLVGYNPRSRHRDHDVGELADMLQAYARLVQEIGNPV